MQKLRNPIFLFKEEVNNLFIRSSESFSTFSNKNILRVLKYNSSFYVGKVLEIAGFVAFSYHKETLS